MLTTDSVPKVTPYLTTLLKQAPLNTLPNIPLPTLNLHPNSFLRLNRLPPYSIHIKLRLTIEDRLHLLDTSTLGLLEEEKHKRGHHNIQNGVKQKDVRAHLRDHVGCDERVHEIEEPLRGDAYRAAHLSDAGWEDLGWMVSFFCIAMMVRFDLLLHSMAKAMAPS